MQRAIQAAMTTLLGASILGVSGCIYAGPPRHRYVQSEVVVEGPPPPVAYDEREVVVTDGPPPPDRVEVIPARPGYPGAYWVRGHWERYRRGWVWRPGRWYY
jgi:hypothetical protein